MGFNIVSSVSNLTKTIYIYIGYIICCMDVHLFSPLLSFKWAVFIGSAQSAGELVYFLEEYVRRMPRVVHTLSVKAVQWLDSIQYFSPLRFRFPACLRAIGENSPEVRTFSSRPT